MWMMIAASALSAATPTYLSCEWGEVDGSRVELAVDEANQRITIGRPGLEVVSLPALFTPNEVRATERIGGETQTWLVDRTALTLTISVSFSPNPQIGQCEVKPTPADRAF